MPDQNDDPFKDDDPFEGEFTETSPEGAADRDALDVSEDISDYDDTVETDDEEGIFSPDPPKKKTALSSTLMGTVAAVAILGVGAFFVYQTPSLMEKVRGFISPGEALPQEIPVAADTAAVSSPAPGVQTESQPEEPLQADLPLGDQDLANLPQPQPISNLDQTSETVPLGEPEKPLESGPADTSSLPVPAPVQEAVSEPVPSPSVTPEVEANLPSPPSPEESVRQAAAPPAGETPVEPEAVEVSAQETTVSVSPVPSQAELKPAEKTVVPPMPAEKGQSSSAKVTKPATIEKTEFFDSPGGKALETIPAPSMDINRGPNEKIIIVHNPSGPKASASKKKSEAPKKIEPVEIDEPEVFSRPEVSTSSEQESRIVAAGRAVRLGRYDAALEMYEDLYRLNPRDGRILMGRAVALQKLGRSAEAIKAYETLLDVDDNNPEALVNLTGLIRKEYPAVALEKLLDLKSRYPESSTIAGQLGVAYADAGNLEEAMRSLQGAARMEPKNPQHFFNMAVIAERMKDRSQAVALYEKALEVDAVYGSGRAIDRNRIYDRLARIRE